MFLSDQEIDDPLIRQELGQSIVKPHLCDLPRRYGTNLQPCRAIGKVTGRTTRSCSVEHDRVEVHRHRVRRHHRVLGPTRERAAYCELAGVSLHASHKRLSDGLT